MWQYTDNGSIPGVNSPVDLNTYDMTDTDFLASWAGATFPAPKPPVPGTAMVELSVSSTVPVKLHIVANENIEVIVDE